MKRIIIFTLSILIWAGSSMAQDKKELTLQDVIEIASKQSLDAFINKNMYLAKYWEYRYFKANRLPSLNLDATPFDYNRSIQKVYNSEENRDKFLERETFNSDLSLQLSQKVGLTGGTVFAHSNLNLTRKLGDDKVSSYSSTPFQVGYSQNINGYNAMRWEAKIEPIKFEKAKKQFIQDKEDLSIKATRLFFNLLEAQIEILISETNMANADTLFTIAEGRFQVGTVTQDDLLDFELGYMNAKLALTKAKLRFDRSKAALNSFLSFDKKTQIECIVPQELPELQINAAEALTKAIENNPIILNQKQRMLQQDERVQIAKSNTGVSGDVYAMYGLNNNSNSFDEVYQDPLDRQRLKVGINLPILDWGRRKGKLLTAKSNREAERLSINKEKIDFEQNIFMNVMEFNLQGTQVENSAKADTIAQMKYDVSQQRFLIGKQDIIRLNTARNDRENARRNYINSLQTYWEYYFTIRKLTLFDFEKNMTLSEDFDKIVNKF